MPSSTATTSRTDIERRDWIDPQHGKQSFGSWAERWLATVTHLQPTTQQGYESIVAKHLLPRFADVPIGSIDHPTILAFLSDLKASGAAAGTIRNVRDVARLIFELAVRSAAIKTNPVKGVKAPRSRPNEMVFLDADQVMALSEAITEPPVMRRRRKQDKPNYPEFGLLVRFAAWTGLRAGEIVALRVGKVDLMRRRVEVAESAAEAHGKLSFGPTKTYARRSVPLPAPLAEELALHIAGKKQTDFVFEAPDGGPIRHSNWYPRHFKPAAARAGLPDGLRFHDLRHTYAAFPDRRGRSTMMERRKPLTINVTLSTYGHLLPNLEERIDDALGQRYRGATAPESAAIRSLGSR
ncbi:MAG: tyrosine-type recombinase/integrase [Acidimicrobiales bacterium]